MLFRSSRLSAAYVQECLRRETGKDVVRYVVRGWIQLIHGLEQRARELDVTIETRCKVTTVPPPPVVIATPAGAAARLLDEPTLRREGTRVALFDLGLSGCLTAPPSLFDLDGPLYFARYTAFDPSLAPPGEDLVQVVCSCRPAESFTAALSRIRAFLDVVLPRWRDHIRWSRTLLLRGATGVLDLPESSFADRPAIIRGPGIFCAGDYVFAPGLLAEVSFASGLISGAAAGGS